MIKCLMLDVDGVLVDGRPGDGRAWNHDLFQDLGIRTEDLVSAFFLSEWEDIVVGRKALVPSLTPVLAHIAPHVSVEAFIDYWFRMDSRIVEPVLQGCRTVREQGIKVYLTTNQEHQRARYLMLDLGLGGDVDGILYSAVLGARKPQPEFFAAAQKATKCTPDELLLVDDTLENVDAARRAGWHAYHWDGRRTLPTILQSFQ